jgi:hypothetical protein
VIPGQSRVSRCRRGRECWSEPHREHAFQKRLLRHPEFAALPKLNDTAAVIEARPEHIAILNYAKGFGHADLVTVGVGGLVTMDAARVDDWGWTPASRD